MNPYICLVRRGALLATIPTSKGRVNHTMAAVTTSITSGTTMETAKKTVAMAAMTRSNV
jgi:hypothetical protein